MTTTYFAKFNDEGLPEGFIPSFHVNNYGGKINSRLMDILKFH